MGFIMTNEERNEMFDEMDANHDNKISYNEFLQWYHNTVKGKYLKEAF